MAGCRHTPHISCRAWRPGGWPPGGAHPAAARHSGNCSFSSAPCLSTGRINSAVALQEALALSKPRLGSCLGGRHANDITKPPPLGGKRDLGIYTGPVMRQLTDAQTVREGRPWLLFISSKMCPRALLFVRPRFVLAFGSGGSTGSPDGGRGRVGRGPRVLSSLWPLRAVPLSSALGCFAGLSPRPAPRGPRRTHGPARARREAARLAVARAAEQGRGSGPLSARPAGRAAAP